MRNGFPVLAPDIAEGFEDYSSQSHDKLVRVEEENFWFVSRNKLLAYLLEQYFPDAQNMLEIGCGTGFVLCGLAKQRPNMSFSGGEAYLSGLGHAQRRIPQADLMQMDARNIPFVQEFDLIGAFDVLEHISEDKTVLQEMHKALTRLSDLIPCFAHIMQRY